MRLPRLRQLHNMLLNTGSAPLAILYSLLVIVVACASSSRATDWKALNATVGGRLHATLPFELPCFSTFNGVPVAADPDACSLVQQNYTQADFRIQHFSAYMIVCSSHILIVSAVSYAPNRLESLNGRHVRPREKDVFSMTRTQAIHSPLKGPIVSWVTWLPTM